MNLERMRNHVFPVIEHDLTFRDSIIYALGLGYGSDPLDPAHLQFLYEKGQRQVPSICCVMAYAGFWMSEPQFEIDWVKLLHGEHYYEILSPLPVEGKLTAKHRVVAVQDKGEGKGAVVTYLKEIFDESGKLLANIEQSNFLRGDGGCGSFGEPPAERPLVPEREPDVTYEIKTSRRAALIYRLSGDYNPVHADPEVARKGGGFREPWLAGMCSMGMATRAAITTFCDNDPDRIKSMYVRFKNVAYPGETMRYEFYRTDDGAQFRVRCVERDVVILDRGYVRFN